MWKCVEISLPATNREVAEFIKSNGVADTCSIIAANSRESSMVSPVRLHTQFFCFRTFVQEAVAQAERRPGTKIGMFRKSARARPDAFILRTTSPECGEVFAIAGNATTRRHPEERRVATLPSIQSFILVFGAQSPLVHRLVPTV